MQKLNYDVMGLGLGPSNIALAVCFEELLTEQKCFTLGFAERNQSVKWHGGILLPWSVSQVSFLKDLATLRNPKSEFTFLNYLHQTGRMDDFINLGTFTPFRTEISDYLAWAGATTVSSQKHFGHDCVGIKAIENDGRVASWNISFANGAEAETRDLVVSVGRDLNIPAEFRDVQNGLVIHSENYLHEIAKFKGRKGLRVAIIGAAQSAAEVFKAVHSDLEDCRPTVIMRKAGFRYYDTSPYLNELFQPEYIDKFYNMSHQSRQDILDQMHSANYSGLAPYLLDDLYRMQYRERLEGHEVSRVLTMRQIVKATQSSDEVALELRETTSGDASTEVFDLVILGTGFKNRLPELMDGVRDHIATDGVAEFFISRDYQVDLKENVDAGIYLQGLSESTHGIADTLLSNLAHRSDRIVRSLIARRKSQKGSVQAAVAAE